VNIFPPAPFQYRYHCTHAYLFPSGKEEILKEVQTFVEETKGSQQSHRNQESKYGQ